MKTCDLHTHSIKSDGTKTPTQLVEIAKSIGLSAIALTDHNTIAGLGEFLQAGKILGVQTIGGIEISCDYLNKELHVVALFIDESKFSAVNDFTNQAKLLKDQSNALTLAKLQADGYDVSIEQMLKNNPDGYINRVHLAQALMEKGYVKSIDDAFDNLLSKEGKYYVQPKRPSVEQTLRFIHKIGAVSVLAHPFLSLSETELEGFLSQYSCLLDGMETNYSTFSAEQTTLAKNLADRFGVLYSGGSDFHGENKPEISLGVGKGSLVVPYEYCAKLKERIK